MKSLFDHVSEECSKITTRAYSTSFSLGIYCLNKKIRNPIYSIYGFVRFADEIVDSFHDFDKEVLLEKFKADTYEAIERKISLNPILNAFQGVVNKFHIEQELIDSFLYSMEMDLKQVDYTAEKYEKYILGSAEVVGLMCLHVFVEGDDNKYLALKPYAMKLGAAFQKINFLRDLKMDFNTLNRSYFPQVDLTKFSPADKLMIEKEIESDFDEALIGIKDLPTQARAGVYLAYVYYRSLFNKIKKVSAERLMQERIRINNFQKFELMLLSLVRNKLNQL